MSLDIVVKVGGSILRGPGDYLRAAEALRDHYLERGLRVAVVVSAARGVTDLLVEAAGGSQRAAGEVVGRYRSIALEVGGPPLERLVSGILQPLERLRGRATSPAAAARILALGEAASRAVMVKALEHAGVKAVGIPARLVVRSRGHPLAARIDYPATREAWASALEALAPSAAVPVVEGFAAGGPGGLPAVLGRGGSDYTATALAALSTASAVHLVTDVDGIYTGDPRRLPGARRVESMGYAEAWEAARYGAKRMHPLTFEPLIAVRPLEVRVGSWVEWTRITPKPEVKPPGLKLAAARTLRRGLAVVSLVGSGASSPRVLSKAAEALAEAGVEPVAVHSTSRASLAFTVGSGDCPRALGALHGLVLGEVSGGG